MKGSLPKFEAPILALMADGQERSAHEITIAVRSGPYAGGLVDSMRCTCERLCGYGKLKRRVGRRGKVYYQIAA